MIKSYWEFDIAAKVGNKLYKLGYLTDVEAATLKSERLDEVTIQSDIHLGCIEALFQFENRLYTYIAVYNIKEDKLVSVNCNSASVTFAYSNEEPPLGSYCVTYANAPTHNVYVPTSCSYAEPKIIHGGNEWQMKI